MEFDPALPAHGESLELVDQGEGLLDDVAELAQAAPDVRSASPGDLRQDPEPTVGGGLDGVAMIFVVLGGALQILGGPTPKAARLLTPLAAPNPHRTVQAANVSGQQAPANCLWA
ncbi:hypothetical protein [Streptomyces sp. NBC_00063]|uniref:hypothetical protein n=1 Tax=Streptomyces sp. NBC_00063 TaxID=2975638 RepID=UPI003D7621C9